MYLVAGQTTRDLLDHGWRLGGSVVYAAMAAAELQLETKVITSHARDIASDAAFGRAECHVCASDETTTFRNIDEGSVRTQYLVGRGGPLSNEGVEEDWRRPDILHLAPVYHEIDADFASWFSPGLRCATLQGWMRSVDPKGRVVPERSPHWEALVKGLDIAVYSRDDLKKHFTWRISIRRSVRVAVETLGPKGCTVFESGKEYRVEVRPIDLVDTTGAGDIFATAFFSEYRTTGDAMRAAEFANRFASELLAMDGIREGLAPRYPSGKDR